MGVKYLHYTSRQFAKEICISGGLRPRRTLGRTYFTQDTFINGTEAAAKLAMSGKPIEVCCIIPGELVKDALENPEKPQAVEPIVRPDGTDLRPGGGLEYFTYPGSIIQIDPNKVHWMSLAVP